jgi:HEAT repeat protein
MKQVFRGILTIVLLSAGVAAVPTSKLATGPADATALKEALQSPDAERQIQAAEAIQKIGSEAAPLADLLVQMLDKGSASRESMMHVIRRTRTTAAMGALIQIGAGADGALIAGLRDRNPMIRANCAFIITYFAPRDGFNDAMLDAARDPDARVRSAALYGLRPLSDRRVFEAVLSALADKEDEVRGSAASRLTPQPADARRNRPAETISNLDNNRASDALIKLLDDPTENVRRAAIYSLGELKNTTAIAPLAHLLNGADPQNAWSAADALIKIGSRQAVAPLIDALHAEKRQEVLREIEAALGALKDPRATNALVANLKHKDVWVRESAALALGQIGDRRAVPALIAALKEESPDRARAAAKALGELGDVRAVDPLIAAMGRGVLDTTEALGELRDPRATEPLADNLLSRQPIGKPDQALAKIKDPRVLIVLCERCIKQPTAPNAYLARRVVGELVGRRFDYDPAELEQWWHENEAAIRESAKDLPEVAR